MSAQTKLHAADKAELYRMLTGGMRLDDCAKWFGCSRSTIMRAQREIIAKLGPIKRYRREQYTRWHLHVRAAQEPRIPEVPAPRERTVSAPAKTLSRAERTVPGNSLFWPAANDLAARFGVHVTTARKWRRERNAPPAVQLLLLADLGAFDPQWRGWRLKRGLLVSPEGVEITPGNARSLPFLRMQIAHYQAESRAARERAPDIEEQPLPASWDLQEQMPG